MKSFVELYEKPLPQNPHWIGGGFLPKSGITLIGGEAKIGKTFLLLDMAHCLALGGNTLWGDEKFSIPQAGTILYFEQEIGEYALQKRLKEKYVGELKPPHNIFVVSRDYDVIFDTNQGCKRARDYIEQSGADVVIIDPISMAMLGDENSNRDVGRLYLYLGELRQHFNDRQLSFVISHHFGKPPKRVDDIYDPLDQKNFRGAIKWWDGCDTAMTVQKLGKEMSLPRNLRVRLGLRQEASPDDFTLRIEQDGQVGKLVDKPKQLVLPSL